MDALRLAGPPGVGKSTAAWAIARQPAAEGERVAYVDIDQLGMCYPAHDDDPDRWELKENALRMEAVVEVGQAESTRLDHAWERLTTDRLGVTGTVGAVLARWARSPAGSHDHAEVLGEPPIPGTASVLWITGPRSVGASSVGWQIAHSSWGRGQRVGFADAAELSFVWNTSTSSPVDNVVGLHQSFTAAGAESFVAVGSTSVGHGWPPTTWTARPRHSQNRWPTGRWLRGSSRSVQASSSSTPRVPPLSRQPTA